jgi:RNA polymerase sigma-70 factor (ECF subfamily)
MPEQVQSIEGPDRRELVRSLLRAAPEEAQEVAVLYWVDELTQAEIGEMTGRSLPTIRKRLREFIAAARAALRTAHPGLVLPEGDEL